MVPGEEQLGPGEAGGPFCCQLSNNSSASSVCLLEMSGKEGHEQAGYICRGLIFFLSSVKLSLSPSTPKIHRFCKIRVLELYLKRGSTADDLE